MPQSLNADPRPRKSDLSAKKFFRDHRSCKEVCGSARASQSRKSSGDQPSALYRTARIGYYESSGLPAISKLGLPAVSAGLARNSKRSCSGLEEKEFGGGRDVNERQFLVAR